MTDPTPIPPPAATGVGRRRRRAGRIGATGLIAATLVATLAVPGTVSGKNTYLANWQIAYPASLSDNNASCELCHGDGDTGLLNPYGRSILLGGTSSSAIAALGSQDADGNGITNLAEITANVQPGWKPGNTNTVYDTNGDIVATNQPAPAGIGILDPSVPPTPTPVPTATPVPPTPVPTATPVPPTPVPTATPTPTPGDTTPPTTTLPSVTQRAGVALFGTAIPVAVKWTGSDNAGGSGIARYELEKSLNGGLTWMPVSTALTSPTTSLTVSSSGTITFRVRAVDVATNVGTWSTGAAISPRLVQNTSSAISYAKTWSKRTATAYSGGSVRFAKAKGATATMRTTGKSFSLVTTKGRDRGYVRVYVNGALKARISLFSSTTKYRQVVWQTSWTSASAPTIRVSVEGTTGHPRVDLDAFAVLK